jgi:hypothetical protein
MKKQQVKRKASKKHKQPVIAIGWVVSELVLWDFSQDDDIICHHAGILAKAIQMRYSLDNFGPSSFGIEDEE